MEMSTERAPVSSGWCAVEFQRLYPERRAVGTIRVLPSGRLSAYIDFDNRPRKWHAAFDTLEEAVAACDTQAMVLLAKAAMEGKEPVPEARKPDDLFAVAKAYVAAVEKSMEKQACT